MRSRYSAYAIGHQEYLLNTWDRSCRPTELALDENIEWTRLTILKKQRGRPQDDKGSVEFVADYRIGGEEFSLRENSRFVKKNLRWFYLVGN